METTYKQFKEKAVEYTLKEERKDFNKAKITKSSDAVGYTRNFYFDDIAIYESTFVILVNNSNDTIGYAKISQGGISGTVVDIRLILKYALDNLASGIILVHNHPSGQLVASPQDRNISNKLKEACALMDISLLDSIIITEDGYLSMADEGII